MLRFAPPLAPLSMCTSISTRAPTVQLSSWRMTGTTLHTTWTVAISPCQAAWNLFEFRNHDEDPPVTRLALHFPEQQVQFREDETDLPRALDGAETTLTCFLRYNACTTIFLSTTSTADFAARLKSFHNEITGSKTPSAPKSTWLIWVHAAITSAWQ